MSVAVNYYDLLMVDKNVVLTQEEYSQIMDLFSSYRYLGTWVTDTQAPLYSTLYGHPIIPLAGDRYLYWVCCGHCHSTDTPDDYLRCVKCGAPQDFMTLAQRLRRDGMG